jgi:hypothetical protein
MSQLTAQWIYGVEYDSESSDKNVLTQVRIPNRAHLVAEAADDSGVRILAYGNPSTVVALPPSQAYTF